MGSKFVEKHKRKSVLAALLFIFQGRVKYVSILLMVMLFSVPFVISGETLGRIIELPPVASFLKTVGLGSVVSALNPKYSNDLLRAALDKAADDSAQSSLWAKFLKGVNATMPPANGPSTLALLRGGGDFGPLEVKDDKIKRGPGQVKGAVNEAERQRGETGDNVNLEGLLAGVAGGGEGGLNGDLMGQSMANNYGGGSSPYISRSVGGMSAGGRAAGMYSNVMGQSAAKIPVPGSPQKVNTKRMGSVSGFSWKNVGYKTRNAKIDLKLGAKKPMFQLAETFAMTGTAFKSKDAAFEYQTSYVGSTYDGNDANLDVIQTDAAAPVMPDTGFAGDLINATGGVQQIAKDCSDAQGTNGAQMSKDGKEMDDVSQTLGSPPKCCKSGVGAWNAKIHKIIYLCNDFNVNEAQLASKCQNVSSPMDCSSYSSRIIKPCKKWKCWLAFLLVILGFLTFGIVGMILAAALTGTVSFNLKNLSGKVDAMIGFIASDGDKSQQGDDTK